MSQYIIPLVADCSVRFGPIELYSNKKIVIKEDREYNSIEWILYCYKRAFFQLLFESLAFTSSALSA